MVVMKCSHVYMGLNILAVYALYAFAFTHCNRWLLPLWCLEQTYQSGKQSLVSTDLLVLAVLTLLGTMPVYHCSWITGRKGMLSLFYTVCIILL